MRPDEVALYVRSASRNGVLDYEIETVRLCLIDAAKHPVPYPDLQRQKVANYTMLFHALLTEKARQKPVENVGQHDSRPAENSSTRPAHNPTRRKSIWNVLTQKITGR